MCSSYISLVSGSVSIIPENADVFAPPDTRLKIPLRWKSGSCMRKHSRTDTYTSSDLWNVVR